MFYRQENNYLSILLILLCLSSIFLQAYILDIYAITEFRIRIFRHAAYVSPATCWMIYFLTTLNFYKLIFNTNLLFSSQSLGGEV